MICATDAKLGLKTHWSVPCWILLTDNPDPEVFQCPVWHLLSPSPRPLLPPELRTFKYIEEKDLNLSFQFLRYRQVILRHYDRINFNNSDGVNDINDKPGANIFNMEKKIRHLNIIINNANQEDTDDILLNIIVWNKFTSICYL